MDLDWVDVFPIEHRDISAIAMLEGWPPSPGMLHNPPFWIAGGCCWFWGNSWDPPRMNPGLKLPRGIGSPNHHVFSIRWPMDVSNHWPEHKKKPRRFGSDVGPEFRFRRFLHFFPHLPGTSTAGSFQRSKQWEQFAAWSRKWSMSRCLWWKTSRWKVAVKVGDFWSTGFEVLLFSLSLKSCSNLKLGSEKRNQWCTRPPPCWSSMLNFPTVSILILH